MLLKSRSLSTLLIIIFLCCLAAYTVQAQITFDGTMGPSSELSGPHYQIDETMGKQVGGNLFHSFGKFNINTDEIAFFTGSDTIKNVISRVTGGEHSLIDGRLRSEIPGADFFLINPWGITFGPNGFLDVSGSFHLSTSDYLRLGDEGRFDAVHTENTVLTTAPPSAFGFLSDTPSDITLDSGRYLEIPRGETLSLTGGDMEIKDRWIRIEGGQVNIASVASPGEAMITKPGTDISDFEKHGNLFVSDGAAIDVNGYGERSGEVHIRGGRFELSGKSYISSITDKEEGGEIDIRLSEDMIVADGQITTVAEEQGKAGDITLAAKNLEIRDGGVVSSYSKKEGQSGNIKITTRENISISGSETSEKVLYTDAFGSGSAGNISMDAKKVEINQNGKISASNAGHGSSGDISLTTREFVTLTGESGLYAQAEGDGYGGNVAISGGMVSVSDDSRISASSAGWGDAGYVSIDATHLNVTNGGLVITSAYGSGSSGDISVSAFGSAEISGTGKDTSALAAESYGNGDAGSIAIVTNDLRLADEGFITTASRGNGRGGNVILKAERMDVTGGGKVSTGTNGANAGGDISVTIQDAAVISGTDRYDGASGFYADTKGKGNAGAVTVSADSLTIADNGIITSSTSGKGSGGNLTLDTGRLSLLGGGKVVSAVSAEGKGSNLSITARDDVSVTGTGSFGASGLYAIADPDSQGDAGTITVSTKNLSIEDNGTISGEIRGAGHGGNMLLDVDEMKLTGGGSLTTTTHGLGKGGDISILAEGDIAISGSGDLNSRVTANANVGTSGNSGNIHISADSLSVADKGIIFDQAYGTGQSGDITIDVNHLEIKNESSVSTDTYGGNSGGKLLVEARDAVTISGTSELSAKTKGTLGPGDAGDIHISTGVLALENEGLVNNGTGGQGNGGNIVINADQVEMRKGYITSSTEEGSAGTGGDISITAADSVHIAGSGADDEGKYAPYYGVYAQTQGTGHGGNITISADEVRMDKDGWINGQTYGSGNGGNVTLDVNRLETHEGGIITTSTRCTGNAGDISITAGDSVNLSGSGAKQERSWIFTATYSSGRGGDLSISTPELTVGQSGAIYADTLQEDKDCCEAGREKPDGRAGDIYLNTDRITLEQGGAVSASTWTAGQGGDIRITAKESVTISGTGDEEHRGLKDSGIYASARDSGKGGTIHVSTNALTIAQQGQINTSASASGDGGDITLLSELADIRENASVTAKSSGTGKAGNVVVNASDSILNHGGIISTESEMAQGGDIAITTPKFSASENGEISASVRGGDKKGGEINLNVTSLNLSSGAHIESSTDGKGQGGEIHVTASDSVSLSGKHSGLYSTASSSGDAGIITAASPLLTLADTAEISTESSGSGKAGDISLKDQLRKLTLQNAVISSANSGSGDAGKIAISTEESIMMESGSVKTEARQGQGGSIIIATPKLSASGKGAISASVLQGVKNGGKIEVDVKTLNLDNASRVESSTGGKGEGGEILVSASDSIRLSGKDSGFYSTASSSGDAGFIAAEAPVLALNNHAKISTESSGSGRAGNIELKHGLRNLTLTQNAAVSSSNSGDGDAGEIIIHAGESVRIEESFVTTKSVRGKGGSITLTTDMLSASGSGTVSASVAGGEKKGGDITVNTTSLDLKNGIRIEASTRGKGQGGTVHVNASDSVQLHNGAMISAKSTGTGNAGDISINAVNAIRMDKSAVTTEAGNADGGNIMINNPHHFHMLDSEITATVGGGEGNGGNITMVPELAIAEGNSAIIANAYKGRGGNIRIRSDGFVRSSDTIVSASSELGIDGSVEIESQDISSTLSVLPANFLDASRMLPCSERVGENTSSFVLAGRDGIPTPMDDWLASPRLPFKKTEAAETQVKDQPGQFLVRGETFFRKGDFVKAAQTWEQAIKFLNTEEETYLRTVISLADAYCSLGHYQKPLSFLRETLSAIEKENFPYHNALVLSRLGDLLLCLGNVTQAEDYLKKAEREARFANRPCLLAGVLNNLGNVLAADEDYQGAMTAYEKSLYIIENSAKTVCDLSPLKSKILINLTRVRLMTGEYAEAVSTLDDTLLQIRNLGDSHHKASDLISLSLLARDIQDRYTPCASHLKRVAYGSLNQAKQIGDMLKDDRILSYSYGYLARFSKDNGDDAEAVRLTRRALFFAQQGNHSPEISYLWQWQLGRLFRALGDTEKSVSAYSDTIRTLDPVRKEFFNGYRGQEDIFDEKVKPVYLELAELHLKAAETVSEKSVREKRLRIAMDTMELLKAAELQDYFEDECVTVMQKDIPNEKYAYHPPPHTALIYPILFPDHLTLLLILPDSVMQKNVPVSSEEIREKANLFRERLQEGAKTNRILYYANPLYDWLIRSVEAELAARETDTLIVAPDGVLRLIPFAALHDGRHFLTEKYAVVTIPGIRLTDSASVSLKKVRVLLSGISEGVQGFDPLPGVEREFEELRKITTGSEMLLNQEYTADHLFDEFKKRDYSVVHISTHGVFDSDPRDTFLLTYDSRLTMDQLGEFVALGRFHERQLELLTLSACQTALGDERSALGLAGLALSAGAKSALATLWSVYDDSASLAVTEFYRQLGKPGISKAKALQNAQKKLISRPRYSHPACWAPFLLIGNWS